MFKPKIYCSFVVATGCLSPFFLSSTAYGISLNVIPSVESLQVGQSVNVDVTITGLGNGEPPSLSAFDLDINFDPTVLSFNSATFGDQLDLSGFGTVSDVVPGTVNINAFEISLDFPETLDEQQLGDFTLITLNFTGVGFGNSPLELSDWVLGDSSTPVPLTLVVDEVNNASVSVVPEPLTILGSLTALGFGTLFKRKLSKV
ncbi:MAG: PEP-CTERM sorting domain-containing protein [Crocosphaera sp.]|nr:PEP-CTERM sorting domain-containing protein [Crocosphaera sp.]